MGHERIGMLPKTKRWRSIVSEIASSDCSSESLADIAANTLNATQATYLNLKTDKSVLEAFGFLVNLAHNASRVEGAQRLADETPLSILRAFNENLGTADRSLEIRELVRRATADTLASWHRQNISTQIDLFQTTKLTSSWGNLGSGAAFCEISRLFFSNLTLRHLNYYIEREASAALPALGKREEIKQQLQKHIQDVSKHSFETAKITQSLAAGWFNKHALKELPNEGKNKKFLSYAFDKLREELRREGKK